MKYFNAFLFLLLAISCAKRKPKYEITKVELARSGAWSDYGASISIDSAFNYKYYGDYGKVKQGYFTGKASNQFWDTLNQKLEHIKYKTLAVTDNATTQDANYFELIVHWRNGERHISRVWNYPSDSVLSTFKWIDTSYRKIKLHQVKDTIRFESKYHQEIILPLIDRVKFPPPILEHKARKKRKQHLDEQ